MTPNKVKTRLNSNEDNFCAFKNVSSIVNNARIVGIGEGAHFVSEFSSARCGFVQYLIENHGFNAVGLECGTIQAGKLSEWLNSNSGAKELKLFSNSLTYALYGSFLIWLKSYLHLTGKKVQLIGIDLPNTLSPREDIEELASCIQLVDPPMKSHVQLLFQILETVDGESAVISAEKWGNLSANSRDKVFSEIVRLKLRILALAPMLSNQSNSNIVQKTMELIITVEHILETLRGVHALFNGVCAEGDTSVRDSYMAGAVSRIIQANPKIKMVLLAHNNHLQKTPVSFAGELTSVPMGQHLASREDYCAIGFTHLGRNTPEMEIDPVSPLGFKVVIKPADTIRQKSVEHYIIENCGIEDSCLVFTDRLKGIKYMRSQNASIVTNLHEAFDAVFCTPFANKDRFVP
ncbi:erythromycin esterase [Mariniphaga anaerophila]|uniref:Erythromycin esterase n=1 Tax=Mariniphaga anaerophila TaxID=1484053 RepID=A0A1M4ZP69_9BACT|nr:erythromycin esterase family protein [Mariniphaga anaerophila]SHF19833.1 erythromycin esterase [Mariniphaga anaerophila]